MESLDYEVTTGVLLAADYRTPQLRQRLFFLGSRRGFSKIQLPYHTHSAIPGIFTKPYVTVGEAFTGLPPLPIECAVNTRMGHYSNPMFYFILLIVFCFSSYHISTLCVDEVFAWL